jgi:hypothetical protein
MVDNKKVGRYEWCNFTDPAFASFTYTLYDGYAWSIAEHNAQDNNTYEVLTVFGNTIYHNGTIVSSSDLKVKKEIQDFETSYDRFFDNLIPRKFKYKDGTSNRFHSGFVAQEVL